MNTGTASHESSTISTSTDQPTIVDSTPAVILNSVLPQARNSKVTIRPVAVRDEAQVFATEYGPDAEDQGSIENEAIEAFDSGQIFNSNGADRIRDVEQETSQGHDSRQSFEPSREAQTSVEMMDLATVPAAPLLSSPNGIEPTQIFRQPPGDDTLPSFSVSVPLLPSSFWNSVARIHHFATGPVDSQHP